ncbi:protein kinase [Niallia sp. XMNu-256]|uniref:serine/threonine protein kinase n=1 Tax=Niallia sp. XMNu-256 TaxID=3082444 RepID=UPI0030CA5BF0
MIIKEILYTTANIIEKPFQNGSLIDHRFEVIEFLGRGSYGNSYLVLDRKIQQYVVLKSLRIHKRIFQSGRLSFQAEQSLLKRLHHPYFPAFFDNGAHNQIPYFTMEYVKGKTFEQLIFDEEQVYSEKQSFQIGNELLQIIKWLHAKGIVHRDIRIPNVLLDGEQIRLIDFGLARRFSNHLTKPIHVNHIKRAVAPISDYYALGHFILFLLYSSYDPEQGKREKSWEEELSLSATAHKVIRKLLAIDEPYRQIDEIQKDFHIIIYE